MRGMTLVVMGLLAVTTGCGYPTVANPTGRGGIVRMKDRAKNPEMLRDIGLAYMLRCDEGNPPKGADDLLRSVGGAASYAKPLKDGDLVVIWGVRINNMQAPGQTILGYEKDSDEHATRYVLMCDGSVRGMTEQEFQAAPKAKVN